MSASDEPMVMRFSEPKEVSAEGLQDVLTMTEEDLRARYPKRKRGEHTWVVGMVFTVEDPTEALDNLTLGVENMVGFIDFWCVWCQQKQKHLAPLGPEAMCPGVPKQPEPRAIIGEGGGKTSSYTGVRSPDPPWMPPRRSRPDERPVDNRRRPRGHGRQQ